jgi:hypothetical protein
MRAPFSMPGRARRLAFASALLLASQAVPSRAQSAQEYAIKASFVAKFVAFVKWPPPREKTDPLNRDEFTVTVFGANPFHAELESALRSAGPRERPIRLRTVKDVKELAGSKLIFIGQTERKRVAEVVAWAESNGALTVGDGDGYAGQGVIINFYLSGSKVRFEINPAAAERSGFQISSLLLKVARIVGDG